MNELLILWYLCLGKAKIEIHCFHGKQHFFESYVIKYVLALFLTFSQLTWYTILRKSYGSCVFKWDKPVKLQCTALGTWVAKINGTQWAAPGSLALCNVIFCLFLKSKRVILWKYYYDKTLVFKDNSPLICCQ